MLEMERILIVDDEPDILETVEDLLAAYDVTTAGTHEDAKHLLETGGFDIAILDIMGVNGLELLEEAVAREIPTVMLTAHQRGACVVAVFTFEVAEEKARRANDMGREAGYPLTFTTEREA